MTQDTSGRSYWPLHARLFPEQYGPPKRKPDCDHFEIYWPVNWSKGETRQWYCNRTHSAMEHRTVKGIEGLVPAPHPFKHDHQDWEEYCEAECDVCNDDEYGVLHTLWTSVYEPRLRAMGALQGQLSLETAFVE